MAAAQLTLAVWCGCLAGAMAAVPAFSSWGACCYTIGLGAMNVPCCLKTKSGLDALYCPDAGPLSTPVMGGQTGFTWLGCPATAAEAKVRLDSELDYFSLKSFLLYASLMIVLVALVLLLCQMLRPKPRPRYPQQVYFRGME
mmetsp:Transcript_28060/g.80920  ORF Transcript_28060/g.80920 Transcript_28060/m.80920 type:complete len:142 (+) Transcript_28060:82-507(+)